MCSPLYTYTDPKNYWHKDLKYLRKEVTTECRLKFGHGCYPAHLKKIGVLDTDLCDVCNVVADLEPHIFLNVQNVKQKVNFYTKSLIDLKTSLPYNFCYLLAENKESTYI